MNWLTRNVTGHPHSHPEGKRRGYCSGCEQERLDRSQDRKQQKRRKRVRRG